ncbi:MAG: hypothetical protein DRP09_10180 [Candidatus Thorarchaeota archaeon]|nr:MAG: hypothetical protein DRP09_10180 [Candidatus Thorarchaeota archaeon]
MYKKWLRKLLKKAIDDHIIGGFFMMNLLPKAYDHIEKDGIKLVSNPELKSLIVNHFGKDYYIAIIDSEDNSSYAGFFELTPVPSKVVPGSANHKDKWVGYIKINDSK